MPKIKKREKKLNFKLYTNKQTHRYGLFNISFHLNGNTWDISSVLLKIRNHITQLNQGREQKRTSLLSEVTTTLSLMHPSDLFIRNRFVSTASELFWI